MNTLLIAPQFLESCRISKDELSNLENLARNIRRDIIKYSKHANVGHIGSALSVADIIAVLYGQVFSGLMESQYKFILSKGHAALALYAALAETNRLTWEEMEGYCQDNTLLGTHPDFRVPGIELSTGSLGIGLGVAAGFALWTKLKNTSMTTYALISDGECNEGSIWETVMFAGHQKLGNLVVIVDYNHQQALGPTTRILNQDPLAERWKAFGWKAYLIDGHDIEAISQAFIEISSPSEQPRVIIANTVSGHGISYMENQVKWHYLPMSDREYMQAIDEIEKPSCEEHS